MPKVDTINTPDPTFRGRGYSGSRDKLDAAKIRTHINRELNAQNAAKLTSIANNIGPLPEIKDLERREACKHSYQLFNETYFKNRFPLKWSKDHIDLMESIQHAIINSVAAKIAYACMRGFGKTSLAETAVIWALFYDYKKFIVLVSSTGERQLESFESIQSEFESNEVLLEDFPEICYPFEQLEGNWFRSKHQHIDGELTNVVCTRGKIILPTVASSTCAGSVIRCASIGSGALRGRKHTLPDGRILRPDMLIFDDVQTDISAKSDIQVATIERTIHAAVLGMAGPRSSITALMPCTIIRSNDVSDRFIDRQKKPQWNGIRRKLVDKFPSEEAMKLWTKYWEIKQESFRNGNHGREATEFYAFNRIKMDEGAIVTWDERYEPGQLSALEYAMSMYFEDRVAFFCEFQNDPDNIEIRDLGGMDLKLNEKQLQERVSGLSYGVCPRSTLYITSGIDIQKEILFYSTTAWLDNLGGVIVDYGSYPEQPYRDGWTGARPIKSLSSEFPQLDLHGRIYLGLKYIRDNIFNKTFRRDEDKENLATEKVLIDTNWAQVADVPYAFCREAASTKFVPAAGKGVGASMVPMDQWAVKRGEIRCKDTGMWRILTTSQSQNRGKHVSFDTNFWKDILAERLVCPLGNPEALTFWGEQQYQHEFLCSQLAAEYPTEEVGRGRKVNQWTQRPDKPDNHWFDTSVLSMVAAAILGITPHPKAVMLDDGKIITSRMPSKGRRIVTVPA